MIRFLAFLPLLLLAGCATLNEDECRTVDWHDLGVRDGRQGHTQNRLAEHHEACIKHGIRPDDARYNAGRQVGLRDYCVLDNALREGLAGRRYQGVCESRIDGDFRRLNDDAYAVYGVRQSIQHLEQQMQALERERGQPGLTEKRRLEIREALRALDRQYDRLRDELRDRRRELDRTSDRLLGRDSRI